MKNEKPRETEATGGEVGCHDRGSHMARCGAHG